MLEEELRFQAERTESSIDAASPALDVALELTISPAAEPELSYGNLEDSSSPTSIDAILSEDRPSLSVGWDNSVSLSLDQTTHSINPLLN